MEFLSSWQYRRFHVSYVLTWLSIGVLVGLVGAKYISFEVGIVGGVSLGLVIISGLRQRRWWSVVAITLCGLLIGIDRGTSYIAEMGIYKKFAGAQVMVQGVIDDDPTYGKRGDQQFRLRDVTIESRAAHGEIFVGTYNILDVKRGDSVSLQGKLREGFGSYQAAMRYATLSSAQQSQDPVREFRDKFAAGVRNVVAEPAASLGLGFVVGQRSALPEDLDDRLRVVGLTHIVVASGYNLTILVRFMRRLLARHSKYLATVSSFGLMVGFVTVSGLSPSMTRAAAVTGLSLLAWYYGRRFHPLQLILYVAAATAWWYPVYIWSDIGWYLSFLAFGGVLIVAPLLTKVLYGKRSAPAIPQLLIETMAATVMTLPLILFIFGELPVFTLLSNVLVAPVIPLSMAVTVLAGSVGMLLPTGFGIVGEVAGYVIGYVLSVVEVLSSVPWAQLNMSIPVGSMALLYLLICATTVAAWRRMRHNFRATSVID